MYKLMVSLLAMALFLGSCGSSKNTEKLTVASKQGDCVGVAPMKCLLVKKDGQADWEFFYSNIEGFVYEPGYEYVLEVKVEKVEHPAADQSSLKYTLVKEVSKEEKTSDKLPDMPTGDDLQPEPVE
ncbi:DUF4377 domain-containing protein [uncultured Dysgonomonas sp.]|uniref:DUF4377 domain-containing protein n=1 Tax=uncultured Dysgonomonas sp. TaxID=206096 RepID=A0A212JES6_9BACT|nr:DUF4377 domain-containing protein [uncultured Dysgonomonas sp.]SBV97922.1 conserved exported hypothetical protein [uncultured Dysgonomonas sp.]